jgi:hypothetical protein
MVEPRFAIGQEVYVAQDHCSVCKKLELQHPVSVMAIKPYGDGFQYRIKDGRGMHYETKEVCYADAHRGIAVVRATSAGNRLGTIENPLLDENRDRDETCWNTREHVRVTSVFREKPH